MLTERGRSNGTQNLHQVSDSIDVLLSSKFSLNRLLNICRIQVTTTVKRYHALHQLSKEPLLDNHTLTFVDL